MQHLSAPYPQNSLVMLGVIHRDREAERMLSAWLEQSKPGVVTLEFSRYGFDFRKSNGEGLKSKVGNLVDELSREGHHVSEEALGTILSYIDLPAEFSIASHYSGTHRVPLFLIDMDLFSYLKLKEMDKLLAKENLMQLLSQASEKDERYEKALARLFFEKGVKVFPYTQEMYVRDWYMRDRIAFLMRCYKKSSFAHICGWQHLSDPCNLYSPLNPTKVFIYDKTLRV